MDSRRYVDGAFCAPDEAGGVAQVPWGGCKSSGIGRELGRAGYDADFEVKQATRYDHTKDRGWSLEQGSDT